MIDRADAALRWNPRAGLCLALVAVAALGAVAPAPGAEAQSAEPEEEQVAERVARGRISFRLYCRSCHGERGTGNGPVAEMLRIPPADLTRIAERNGGRFPAEKIRRLIDGRDDVKGHGSRDMPIWGVAFRVVEESEDEEMVQVKIDRLVHYLESIQVED